MTAHQVVDEPLRRHLLTETPIPTRNLRVRQTHREPLSNNRFTTQIRDEVSVLLRTVTDTIPIRI
jgi:hypothetical protein